MFKLLSCTILLLLGSLIADETTWSPITSSTKRMPIELYEIGYDGTWQQFCDPSEIKKDFPTYPEHDLRGIRVLICKLKRNNLINKGSLLAFGSYKYCLAMRPRLDDFLDKLIWKLSSEDEGRKALLLIREPTINDTTVCYNKTVEAFTRICVGKGNPCIRFFRILLSRACTAVWITTEKILSSIEDVCAGKWITDQIDWGSVFMTINYRE